MRINISNIGSNTLRRGGLVIGPADPVQPVDINTLLSLDQFGVSKTMPKSFEEFDVTWVVSAIGNTDLADYEFRLKTHYDKPIDAVAISAQGTQKYAIHTQTLLSLQTRRTNSGAWRTLGQGIAMQLDDSNCELREFLGAWFDSLVIDEIEGQLANISNLKIGSGGITSTWASTHIEYKIPMNIVLNNFFDGTLNIILKVYFTVDYNSDQECHLDVSVFSSHDANFPWTADVLTLGNTATIAKTIEKLMPTIMAPINARAERGMLTGLCAYLDIGDYFDDHNLSKVKIVPDANFERLEFTFCENVVPPVGPVEPIAPVGGGGGVVG